MKRVIAIVSASAILAVAVFTGLHLQRSEAEVRPEMGEPYPDKPLNNVVLPPKGSGRTYIIQRHKMVTTPGLSKDWRQLDSATIYWDEAHGLIIEDQNYQVDLKVGKSVKYFPGKTETERAGVRRIAIYDKDGRFIKHEVRRKDGTLERQGEYVPKQDQYVQTYYFEDGKSIRRTRIFVRVINTQNINVEVDGMSQVQTISIPTKKFKLFKENVFQMTDQGPVPESEVMYINSDGGYSKRVYNIEGTRVGIIRQGGGAREHGEIYSPDGKNLLVEYDLGYAMVPSTMTYFRPDGTMWQSRMMAFNATNILTYDDAGKIALYKQTWRERPADGDKPAYSILSRVEEFNPVTGKGTTIINMVNDGSRIDNIMYYQPDGRSLYKFLDGKGNVILTRMNNGNKVEWEQVPEKLEKLSIPANRFKRDDPIQLTDFNFNDPRAPVWAYDYEDTENPKIGDNVPN